MSPENAIIKTPVTQISPEREERLRDDALELEIIARKLMEISNRIVEDVKI